MEVEDPLKTFGIILPAVVEMMEEKGLSCSEAMRELRQFMVGIAQPEAVKQAIARLEAVKDEGELQMMLRKECLRALGRQKDSFWEK